VAWAETVVRATKPSVVIIVRISASKANEGGNVRRDCLRNLNEQKWAAAPAVLRCP